MVSSVEIKGRVKSLATLIHEDYLNERPVMVCVLKGANPVRYRIELHGHSSLAKP